MTACRASPGGCKGDRNVEARKLTNLYYAAVCICLLILPQLVLGITLGENADIDRVRDLPPELLMRPPDVITVQRLLVSSPRRRLRVGDLMTGTTMAGLGLAAISLPDLTERERLFLGPFAVAFLT